MVREVFPKIYLNEIPLPNNPLKALNSYIFVSDKRNLIIDTGFNTKVCKDAFLAGVEELNIDLAKTDLLLTHMHPDHTGLADDLKKLGCKVLIGNKDGKLLNFTRTWGSSVYAELNNALDLGKEGFTGSKEFGKKSTEILEYYPLAEGDVIKIGSYELEVIDIPGHTPGHIGLFDRRNKLFFSGDHILNEITPNITFWAHEFDSLGSFIQSLNKIYELDIDTVFPAHRSIIKDYRKRIEEIIAHHEERLDEVSQIIRKEKKTASQTAAEMQWSLSYDKWEDFPGTQKWFASGEAMSHLEHLVFQGKAQRIQENGTIYYALLKNEEQ